MIPDIEAEIVRVAGGNVTDPTALQNLVILANSDSGVRSDLVNALIAGSQEELLQRLLASTTEVTEDSFNTIEDVIGDVSANLNHKTEAAF